VKKATADYETFSAAGYAWDTSANKWGSLPGCSSQKRGLKATGVYPYVEHWSYRPLMIYFDFHDGRAGQWEYGEPDGVLIDLFDHVRAGGIVEGHNVEFERVNWNGYCVPVLGWPRLDIRQTRCSAAKSRAWGLPSALEDVAAVLQTPTQKDPDGERLMRIFSMPRNPTKKDPRVVVMPSESPEEYERYKNYNRIDVQAEFEVSQIIPELSPEEQENWFLDQEINERGVAVDREAIADCIAVFEQCQAKYGAEFRELTGGIEPTELQQFKGWLGAHGLHLPNMQEETLDEALTRVDVLDPCYRPLQLRALVGSASVKKLYALDAYTCRDGRVRGLYMFHSTHHGRTGGYGPQPSNLYSGEWHEPAEVEAALKVLSLRSLAEVEAAYPGMGPLDVINNCMRSLFIAGPGKVLISSDYSAIEDVVLAALSGEEWVLDVHRTHGMIYEAQIARMTGIPFEDFVKHRTDSGGVATYQGGALVAIRGGKHHPLRKQGKLAKLSGGYASWVPGWKKFGADEYYDTDADIKRAILAYRDSVPNTVEFWGGQTRDKFRDTCRAELYGLEGAAVSAVLNPGACYGVGLIKFQTQGDVLYMRLPSGRLIAYHRPRLTPATRQYSEAWELALSYEGWDGTVGAGVWGRWDLYGGVLTQNATGGTARDVMQHGLQNLKRLGYPVVLQTYDEATAEVDEGFGSIEEFEAGLNDLPTWARTADGRPWPIFARGGWRQRRNGKWETS
jgi:DNA polymerase bacteriophage-type